MLMLCGCLQIKSKNAVEGNACGVFRKGGTDEIKRVYTHDI